MQHKLPDRIFGISTKEAYQKYLEESKKKEPAIKPEQSAQPLEVKANIKLSNYIKIPNTNVLISKEEIYKGLDWETTHYALANNGLFMPSPALFMPYLLNVKDAARGKITLYDGNNNPISKSGAEDLYKYMTSGHRHGCWTWLDAKFLQGSGALGFDIEIDHKVVMKYGGKTLQGKISPLEICVNKDCYVDLDFNKQGLPTEKARKQEYEQGRNISFLKPVEGKVALFKAYDDMAILDCLENPSHSVSSPGAFSCAEGTSRKK